MKPYLYPICIEALSYHLRYTKRNLVLLFEMKGLHGLLVSHAPIVLVNSRLPVTTTKTSIVNQNYFHCNANTVSESFFVHYQTFQHFFLRMIV